MLSLKLLSTTTVLSEQLVSVVYEFKEMPVGRLVSRIIRKPPFGFSIAPIELMITGFVLVTM